jgi:hypothetical protein
MRVRLPGQFNDKLISCHGAFRPLMADFVAKLGRIVGLYGR